MHSMTYFMGSRRHNIAANPSKQAEKTLSPFLFYNNQVSFIAPSLQPIQGHRLMMMTSRPKILHT